jgi:hypothetical protein
MSVPRTYHIEDRYGYFVPVDQYGGFSRRFRTLAEANAAIACSDCKGHGNDLDGIECLSCKGTGSS